MLRFNRSVIESHRLITGIILTAALLFQVVPLSHAATALGDRYDLVADSRASATTVHQIGFTFRNTAVPVGSILLEFCSNDPLVLTACTAPNGFNIAASTLAAQTGETGFLIAPGSPNNAVVLSRPAAAPTVGPSTYQFDNVINPSDGGTYYLRISTYTSIDATGVHIEEGGVALTNNDQLVIASEVPPHLTFCAGVTINNFDCNTASSFILNLGEFSTRQTKADSSQMIVTTNAAGGYSISVSGTTLTSGNNVINAPVTPTASATNKSQFGINLTSNGNPVVGSNTSGSGSGSAASGYNGNNLFKFIDGDKVASSATSSEWNKFTVSYIANIDSNQAPGSYATTLSYICLGNF